jgi:hypothetical protein
VIPAESVIPAKQTMKHLLWWLPAVAAGTGVSFGLAAASGLIWLRVRSGALESYADSGGVAAAVGEVVTLYIACAGVGLVAGFILGKAISRGH